jgi:chemotaxis protein methyltransferase CheR
MKLQAEKAYLLAARLGAVMRRHECTSLDRLAELAAAKPAAVETDIAEAMLNNETFFFRDRLPFEQLRDSILPDLMQRNAARRSIRIWSAACSSGQEAYSIAMLLAEMESALAGWRVEVFASDLSQRALQKARAGLYSQFEVQRGLDTPRLLRFFKKEGDNWQLADTVRRRVQFTAANLTAPAGTLGRFDIVFARNVLMYFTPEKKAAALGHLSEALAPGGYLLLGAAETIFAQRGLFSADPVNRGYYRAGDGDAATRPALSRESPRTAFHRRALSSR